MVKGTNPKGYQGHIFWGRGVPGLQVSSGKDTEGRETLLRESGPSKWQKGPTHPREGRRVLGEDNGNFHITWGPVTALSSRFPSGGKRESQGADNAEGDRNHNENGDPNSWPPNGYCSTVSQRWQQRRSTVIPKASTLPSWLANSTPQPWHSSGSECLLFCIQMGLDQDLPLPNSPQNPTPPLLGLALQL